MKPSRRKITKIGIGIVGTPSYSIPNLLTSSSNDSEITGFSSPPQNCSATRVAINPYRQSTVLVPDGDWVVHTFGYVTVDDESSSNLTEMVEVPNYSFTINGRTVKNSDQYWDSISSRSDGQSYINWRFALPPPSEGNHTFTVSIDFPHPITNLQSDNATRVWKGKKHLEQKYEVVSHQRGGGHNE